MLAELTHDYVRVRVALLAAFVVLLAAAQQELQKLDGEQAAAARTAAYAGRADPSARLIPDW